jgi:hypothetical protein
MSPLRGKADMPATRTHFLSIVAKTSQPRCRTTTIMDESVKCPLRRDPNANQVTNVYEFLVETLAKQHDSAFGWA